MVNMLEKFWGNILPEPNSGCWFWMGSLSPQGYGQMISGGDAHRVGYKLLRGSIPDGLTLDHKCRVRCCVNPDHMEPLTLGKNVLRGIGPTAINSRKTHCKRGHEFNKENTYVDKRNQRVCRRCWELPERRAASAALKRRKRAEKRREA